MSEVQGRILLTRFRSLLVTEDTRIALEQVEEHANKFGYAFQYNPVVEEEIQPQPHSLQKSGREVRVKLSAETFGVLSVTQRLAVVWSILVPFGFTPWARYPLPGPHDDVFHYLGPWSSLRDRLLSEGRGHLVWPSLCAAALTDVGAWEGDRPLERFIQAQLHRVGYNPGAVDGMIGKRTTQALRALGIRNLSLQEIAPVLAKRVIVQTLSGGSVRGQIHIPGRRLSVEATGGITAEQTGGEVKLTVSDVGTVIVRVGHKL